MVTRASHFTITTSYGPQTLGGRLGLGRQDADSGQPKLSWLGLQKESGGQARKQSLEWSQPGWGRVRLHHQDDRLEPVQLLSMAQSNQAHPKHPGRESRYG